MDSTRIVIASLVIAYLVSAAYLLWEFRHAQPDPNEKEQMP